MNTSAVLIPLLAVFALSAATPAQAPQPPAAPLALFAPPPVRDIELEGKITVKDKGEYQEHAFEVPPGVTRLEIEFSYQNRTAGSELEIGLFDPQRFRGTSRFSKQRFHLTEFEATPSYLTGAIVAGTWRVSIGVPAISADTDWRATIRMSTMSTPREGLGPTLRAEPGWYAGDLHAHTVHSDGYGCKDDDEPGVMRGCQAWEVVEAARSRQLDFLAITDHNTTSHHAELAGLQETLTHLLLLRGQEVTTFHGHANVYGTSRAIDFRLGFHGRSMIDVVRDVAAAGALLSINHPGRETGDRCTGCGWDAPLTPWDQIEAMEVVNGTVIEGPTAGMPFWYARLNEGHRIAGIGGSDDHGARPNGRVGTPATVIFARELSEAALIDGLRTGRVYVRTRGPQGPVIDLEASAAGRTQGIGGILTVAAGDSLHLNVRIERAAGQTMEVVRDGEVVAALPVATDLTTISSTIPVAASRWVHVRLRDDAGITAFTNPVYLKAGNQIALREAAPRLLTRRQSGAGRHPSQDAGID